jgi:hypothetical protein
MHGDPGQKVDVTVGGGISSRSSSCGESVCAAGHRYLKGPGEICCEGNTRTHASHPSQLRPSTALAYTPGVYKVGAETSPDGKN